MPVEIDWKIFDSDLRVLGVVFLARHLTSELKIFKCLAKKLTPNAFKSLSNILAIKQNYIR